MNHYAADWNDPLVTGRNRVLTHTPLGAYPDEESAKKRATSPFVRSLNGIWKFLLTASPNDMPKGFSTPAHNDSTWLDLIIPGNWQLNERVDDQPIYTNMPYPFQKTPPAPPDVNPTGWYRTTFTVPADWAGRELFLHFESCDSACKVWVNGTEAGYSQDSKLPHEFNITALATPGTNHLAVMVPRYCDGFWLECQDYWHLSGIQRDVTLYSKPKAHIRDFIVQTTFGLDYHDAELFVCTYMNEMNNLAEGYTIDLQLFDAGGGPVFTQPQQAPVALDSPMYGDTAPERTAARFRIKVTAPNKWSAETPYLYTAVMTLKNPDGKAIDFESCRVGFRQLQICDGILKLNGKRLVIRGVNDHEHHPEKGRALSLADMRDEIIAMKRLNFNAIRTSHYPHHSAFYDLCDEWGMYVIDEANLETHGIGALITKDPLWMNAFMERAQRMALRDRNHPSIVGWSLGNESYHGPHHAAMAAWLRHTDPTRPVQYEGGFPGPAISDIMVPMYPTLQWIQDTLANPQEKRPMILCEYAYTKGNALGNFHKFWEQVDRLPRFQGGFIWDWRDKALVRKVEGQPQWAYGNEFDGGIGPDGYHYGVKENPQMCLNGVVNPDLTPKPGALEVKKVQAPVAFATGSPERLKVGEITVWNKYLALDLAHLHVAWELTENGAILQHGTVCLPGIAPGEKGLLHVPFVLSSMEPCTEYWLNLKAIQTSATPWSDAGHVLAWEQFPLHAGTAYALKTSHAVTIPTPLQIRRSPAEIEIEGDGFVIGFDSSSGTLATWRSGEKTILTRPMEHTFMRARTDNDYIIGNLSSYYSAWKAAGLNRLETTVITSSATSLPDVGALVRFVTRHAAPEHACSILCTSTYTITPDGRIDVENLVDASQIPGATLPRIGMQLGLAPEFEQLTWYGRGPHENYIDRKHSANVGLYHSTVDDQFFPFVDPCECGGHEDTRWLRLENKEGKGLQVTGRPLVHFSALHYTTEDLMQAGHVYELTRTADPRLIIDGFHMGLGGDTGWTPNVHPEYLLKPGIYRYGFELAANA